MKPSDILNAIATNNWPDEINSYHQDRIRKLYDAGDSKQAMQEFEKIVNNPLPPKPTLL
jgi:hypothetical protein